MRILILILLMFSLSACAKNCMDRLANNDVNAERARVSFLVTGNTYQERHHSMLKHSAETSLSRGYQYFIIIKSDSSPAYGSRDSAYNYMDRRRQPIAYTDTNNHEVRKFESTVLIKMFNCPQVTDVYDAREILRR